MQDTKQAEFGPWPFFAEDEVNAVSDVLRSGKVNYWTGQEVKQFEKEFAEYCGAPYGIALANGTLALELALRILEIGPGDEVIVTPRTFLASASCIVLQGATPVFAEVDPVSQNITAETIKAVITPKTKGIILVHLAGWPCDMDPIMALAERHQIKVIEDCAQAHGAVYKGKRVGSIGHMSAFSFCQDKIMTLGGEGGILLLNDEALWKTAWAFKDHGKDYDTVFHTQHPEGFRWLHKSFGTNWRITEMQAAIGRKQLEKLPEWLSLRNRNANILNEHFASIPSFRLTLPPEDIYHAYYKHYAFIKPGSLKDGWDRERIMLSIHKLGVPCYSGSCSEIYLEGAFDNTNFRPKERFPVAKELGETSLMFLVHPTLSEEAMKRTGEAVQNVMKEASKA